VRAGDHRREWLGFSMLCAGLFMAILDIQIVAAALPNIAASLHAPLDQLSWVQTAYLITEVIGIAVSGVLARAFSTRWLFATACLGFALTSLGCALSHGFASLIVWRTCQGFAGGAITPTVFAAGFKMFPKHLHARAILIAGIAAMLAPSLGPFAGGYIAGHFGWNWLFYINIPIGLVVAGVVFALVRIDRADRASLRTLDLVAFAALAATLTCLEVMLKVAPEDHWRAPRDYTLAAVVAGAGYVFVRRCVGRGEPLIDLGPLRERGFAAACFFNFVLGVGLFGSLYLLPLFLGFVRAHTPLEIGSIMTVVGVAQLISAPFASIADRRLPAQWVAFAGFAIFGTGALLNGFETPRTDFSELILPQILRGGALLLCILPATNVALDELPPAALANASALLNLMRNVGGAIGIGLVDTIINVRPAAIATQLVSGLARGDANVAKFVGLPAGLLAGVDLRHPDPDDARFFRPFIERAAATTAFNEAWFLLAAVMLLSLLALPLLRRRHA
jgi:DHA2 family multidrug resistance protein